MSILAIRLAIASVLAFAGYNWSGKFEQRYGYTPWRLPRAVWALLFFMGLIIGAVCAAIAERQAKKEYARRATQPPVGYAPTPYPQFGQPQAAYPQPWPAPGAPQAAPATPWTSPPPPPSGGLTPPA